MANTYTWQINALDTYISKDSLSDVVYNIHWGLTATSSQIDGDGNAYVARAIGVQEVSSPDSENFTPFDDLTKEDVEAWLEDSDLDIQSIKDALDAQIEEAITPSVSTRIVQW